jgi:hypothetical protein
LDKCQQWTGPKNKEAEKLRTLEDERRYREMETGRPGDTEPRDEIRRLRG